MQTEIEVKFCRINIEDMRKRLQGAGAYLEQPMRLMRRVNMETEYQRAHFAFLRIRDEGNKVTLTYKQRSDHKASTIDSVKEIEVEVSDFEKTVEIFRLSDLPPVTYQESKRETWKLDEVEVVIDEWPWIEPYIEIEGPSEAAVKAAAAKLGLNWNDVLIAQIDFVYELQYSFAPDVRGLPGIEQVRFDTPVPKELIPKEM